MFYVRLQNEFPRKHELMQDYNMLKGIITN